MKRDVLEIYPSLTKAVSCRIFCASCNILFQIPHKFFKNEILGFDLPDEYDYAVGQLFLSENEILRNEEIKLINKGLEEVSLEILGYRKVPVDTKDIGKFPERLKPESIYCGCDTI